jgi:aldose 1-epimerase
VNPTTDLIIIQRAGIRLELLALGATLRRFDVAVGGHWRNITLGHPTVADYASNPGYLGASVGRFANRIDHAHFTLDGVSYPLAVNAAPNQVHGGPDGFAAPEWAVLGQGEDWAEFRLTSPDGDQGFPGEVIAEARYDVLDDGVEITYTATTSAPTLVNLTNHAYFNLNGEGAGTIDDHVLSVDADTFTVLRPDGVPTGEIHTVERTGLDFRTPRAIGTACDQVVATGWDRDGGIDHNFAINGSGMRRHAVLSTSELSLAVFSDLPGLQVYVGNHFAGEPGTSGAPYPLRAGVALETQTYPDAPNHPNFPSAVLRPGQEYHTTTRWQLAQ